jgi:flagellar biosynthesis/type III secretory pathway chaperone
MHQYSTVVPPVVDFDSLLDNLACQSALYDELLALSERERDAIGRADLITLQWIIARKEEIIGLASQLEMHREASCAHWAQDWGLDGPPTIHDMRERATSAREAAQLDAVTVELSQRVARLRRANTRNAQLITQVQRLGDRMITIAARYGHHPTYDNHGDTSPDAKPSLFFDYKA